MSIHIGVFGTTKNQARMKLLKISESLPQGEILGIRLGNVEGSCTIDMKNGDRYTAVFAGDSARGHRWKQVYVPYNVDLNILHNVILPKIISNLPEHEQVIGYWH